MNIEASFTITFVSLLISALLNITESIRTTLPNVRHILSLEACVAIIAAYFYYVFINKTKSSYMIIGNGINYKEITELRYLEWAFTTPLMLLALCIFLSHRSKSVTILSYVAIVLFDYFMLYFGYLGETKQMDKMTANIIGFIGYIGLFSILFKYVNKLNSMVYSAYAIIWAMYGFVYFLDDYNKNFITNWLDLISKSFVGIGLWAYYVK